MPPSRPRRAITKLQPARPPPPPGAGLLAQQPTKVLQGQRTRRADTTHAGHPRTSLFVTRRTRLGALIARARGLVLDEGASQLRLLALGAAVPHAFVLLYALMDILPFPVARAGQAGMWFAITTGTAACRDVVQGTLSGLDGEQGGEEGEGDGEDWGDLGAALEDEPEILVRNKSSVEIVLHISGRTPTPASKKKARPSAKKRRNARGAGNDTSVMDVDTQYGDGGEDVDEEALMNM